MDFQDDDDIRSHERRYVDTKYHFSQIDGTPGEKRTYVKETTADGGVHRQLFHQSDSYTKGDGTHVTKVESYVKGGFTGDTHGESDEGGAY